MRPVTVTVGPLAGAKANGICLSQTPNAGTIVLNGSPTSGTNTNAFVGTGSISANVLTITATASGTLSVGQALSGQGVSGGTTVIGTGQTANTWIVFPAQTVSSTTIYGNALVTQDKPRQVLFTFAANETGHSFVVTGTDWAGNPANETVPGTTAGTVATVLSYATVSQITISANATGAITVGTNGVADSQWTRFDDWALSALTIQANASGTVNYTVNQSMDDPNSPVNPVSPSAVTWLPFPDTNLQAQTASAQGQYAYVPTWLKITLNSGSGSVALTATQPGSVTY